MIYKNWLEAREKLRKYSDIPRDEKLVALDFVEDKGLNDVFDPMQAAELMRAGGDIWGYNAFLPQRLKNLSLRKRAGSSYITYNVFYKPALVEYLNFLHVSLTHIRDYRLSGPDYMGLATKEMVERAVTAVKSAHPELFVGALKGSKKVQRAILKVDTVNNAEIYDYLMKSMPHDNVSGNWNANNLVFHFEALREVLKVIGQELKQKYNNNNYWNVWDFMKEVQ